jgi:ribosomal protein L9
MTTLRLDKRLTIVECGVCAVDFAMPETMHESCQEDGRTFFCPNGHKIGYSETEVKRLRQQVEQERRAAARATARADQAEASATALKGHNTRLRKRASAGVCPCCNRTFKQLAAHMKSQHPEFPEKDPA